jgi:hypothetical protein
MVSDLVGFPGALLDDKTFRSAWLSRQLGVHVVFSVDALRQATLTIVKEATADIAGRWSPLTILDELENVSGPWGRSERLCVCISGRSPGCESRLTRTLSSDDGSKSSAWQQKPTREPQTDQ